MSATSFGLTRPSSLYDGLVIIILYSLHTKTLTHCCMETQYLTKIYTMFYITSSFRGRKNSYYSPLSYYTVQYGRRIEMFRRNILHPSSGQKDGRSTFSARLLQFIQLPTMREFLTVVSHQNISPIFKGQDPKRR